MNAHDAEQEPMAWLFKAQKPGVTSWWASVDENEIRQPERGEWTLVNKTPLYRSTAEPPRAPEAQEKLPEPVAWLHTVKQNDGDEDEDLALSFSPDSFPLMGEAAGFFQSIRHEPLYTVDQVRAAALARRSSK